MVTLSLRRSRWLVPALLASGAALPLPQASVRAQGITPAVDPCTAISVNQDSLRDVLTATNAPITATLQTTINSIAGLPLLGGVVAPINIDVAATVDTAVTANPLTLDILDTAGNPVVAGACNLTADALTLNDQGGIAIGGNLVTGLGVNGLTANAGTTDSIALGNNAVTGALAGGAVAIGTGANVTVANGVALGNGSIADRGALTGYVAAGITGTSNSVGSVSVGAAGSLRQITNLAPGSALTDAATVGQVQGALDAVATVNTAVGANTTAIAGLTTSVGTLNTQVTANTGAITGLTTDLGTLTATVGTLGTQVTGNTAAIAGLITDLATVTAQVATNTGAIATLDGRVTANTGAITGLTTDLGALTTTVSTLGTQVTGNSTAIAGLTTDLATVTAQVATNTGAIATLDGRVTANTGAITGLTTDLGALTTQVEGNTTAIATLNGNVTALDGRVTANTTAIAGLTTDVGALTTGLATLDGRVTGIATDVAGLTATVGGLAGDLATLDGRVTGVIGDVADLTTDVAALGTQVAGNTTAIANIDARVLNNTTAITNLDARVIDNTTAITNIDARVLSNTTQLGDIDARVTLNTTAITNLQTQVANVPVGYVQDGNPSQPSSVPTNTAAMIGVGGAAVRLTNVAAGTVATGSTDAVNGGQLAATNAALAANVSATASNSAAIAALDASAVKYDDAGRTSITLAGAGGTRNTNVAAGNVAAGSSDAVNGAQLAATNAQVIQNTTAIANITTNLAGSTVVAVQYSNPDNPTVSNGGTITNDVTLVGATAAPVAIHNVAAGTRPTDAVNMSQLQSMVSGSTSTAQSYTDSRLAVAMDMMGTQLARVDFDISELRKDAMSGVAGAMAYAGIPQTMDVGKMMLGGAISHYRGQTAVAFGFSSALNDGKAAVKVGGSFDSRGHLGVTAGGGIAF